MKRNKEDEDLYLDWVNNFMTIERFAEYYSISKDHALEIISRARIAREIEISNINDLPPDHILEYDAWYKKSFQFD